MDQKVDQKKIGKYEILAELGQGGMGTVYKARDPFIGRVVALKTINAELVSDPEILKRFYREAQSAGTLEHPNIVTIYDMGEADGRPYIAMQFVEGESLQSIINRRGRIPLAAKLKLVQQICEGLGHAHKHGFVHRDVKPANILVTSDGVVKIVDFGIVHLESTNLTKTGMFLGTIHYASPEQINDGRVDSRSDLWSVACVVYEFIAYKKAFDGTNIAAIIAKVLSSEPEPLSVCCPGSPPELDAVISKGLKKSIEARYQSLDEFLGDLLPIARGLQQSFIGDLILEARDLRDKGDFTNAQEKLRAILILDNTHGEAKRLQGELASEIRQAAPIIKAKKLVAEAEQAFSRGEYIEAVRILGEAQQLNPADTVARNLKEKALQEQNRVTELREALSSGQKAMKLGDLTGAEQELHRVLQLDQTNPQAAELLEQIRQDRLARERDFRLKESLWQTDNLVSQGKYEEAQNRLLELQQDFPTSDEIHLKLQLLDPLIRARKLVKEGEHAFSQGEYGEAVRALSEALELNPDDAEARDLKARALQERDRLRQVREALSSGQRAMRLGDGGGAEREFQRVLQLDPANTQATSLISQIVQERAARERESRFREALQQCDNLAAAGKFDDAQRALFDLQQQFPDSTEIDQKLLALDQQMKRGRLISEGQHAFDQGEFGEAVRILTEAQEMNPGDATVRDLKVRAVQERDRLRQVREAISAGQRAMRQGGAGAAEREFKRALQLDPTNAQATKLLGEVQKEHQAREREERIKEGLKQADNLIQRKRFDDAQRKLTELQQSYPDADAVQQKVLVLNQRRAETAAPLPRPPIPSSPPVERASPQGPPLSDAARSLQLAEELRRNLQGQRPGQVVPPAKLPTPPLPLPIPQAPAQASQPTVNPMADPPEGMQDATMLVASNALAQQIAQELKSREVPSPPPPPFQPVPQPRVQPPVPPPPVVEPQKAAPVSAPPRPVPKPKKAAPVAAPAPPTVTPAPPVAVPSRAPSKLPMIMVAGIVLVVILAIGGYFVFRTPSTGGGAASTEETRLETDAKGLQNKGDLPGALGKWQELAAKNGGLKKEADDAVADLTAKVQQALFDQAKAAQDQKKWDEAITLYNKVADLNGTLKDQAMAAIPVIKQQQQGLDISKIEKQTFQDATNALKRQEYATARSLFAQVVGLKVPDSTLAPQAQTKLADLDQIIKAKTEYDAAEHAEKTNDLKGALAQYQKIADGGGTFAQQAKARIPKVSDLIKSAAGNAAAQQEFTAAVQAETSGDLNGALNQFKNITGKSGPFKEQAQTHIQDISGRLIEQEMKPKFDAALQAEHNNDLSGALDKFKEIAARPSNYQEQAKSHIQQLNDQLASKQQFDDAVRKQNGKDLEGALAAFKVLAAKPGSMQAQAMDRVISVSQAIADGKSKPPEPKPVVSTTTTPPPPPASRNVVVTPLVAGPGDLRPLTRPYSKGMIVPDYNVDGGLQSTNLSMPPVPGAPAGSMVLVKITIDEGGNVTQAQTINDTSGFGPDVAKAARAWKFKPPTAKNKPVTCSISVRVNF